MVPKTQKNKTAKEPKSSATKSSSSNPQTMEDLLAGEGVQLSSLKRGDKVKAKVLKMGKREILAEIGAKSYGIIVGREYELMADMKTMIEEGKTYDAEVIIPEMEDGETLISIRRQLTSKLWDDLLAHAKNHTELKVTPLRVISSGLLVDCMSLRGFIPQQQIDPEYQKSPERLMGHRLTVQVLEVDRTQNRLVLSHKEVTQKKELAEKRAGLAVFKAGDKVTGTISSLSDYALTADIKKGKHEAQGTVHISEVTWERVDNLKSLYKEGDSIKAQVIGIDEREGKLALSIKALTPDPWDKAEERYPDETQVSGVVTKVSNIGAFVELEKGVEGLIHVSRIPAGKEFTEGEKVSVTIDKLDAKNRKISLAYVSVTKPIGYR